MNRLIASCLVALLLAQVACAFPAQLEQLLNEDPHQVAKRLADDEALYRIQRSQASCSMNCINCGKTWMTKFDTDNCMKYCKKVPGADSTNCRAFYMF